MKFYLYIFNLKLITSFFISHKILNWGGYADYSLILIEFKDIYDLSYII